MLASKPARPPANQPARQPAGRQQAQAKRDQQACVGGAGSSWVWQAGNGLCKIGRRFVDAQTHGNV